MQQVGKIAWVLFKTLVFTVLVPGTVGFWIPARIIARTQPPGLAHASAAELFFGRFLFLAGVLIYCWCAWDFSVKGLGTPAPIDAPKNLVVNGLYRLVRNPMYTGVAAMILGKAAAFRSPAVLFYLAAALACCHLFIVFYEEPHLRKIFGEQYRQYCRRVPRWLPVLRGAQ